MSQTINCADDLKKVLKPLEQKMNYKTEFRRTFGQNGDRIIVPSYRTMKRQLMATADEEKVKITDKDRSLVRQSTEIIVAIVTSESITQYVRDFADDYLVLINNWNLQLGKNGGIDLLVKTCQRILDDAMTMKDTTDVMRRATRKLRELLRYKPAAFELSKHYLKSLQEDIEKREETTK